MSPNVSIIIPMRNEEQRIGGCLDSVLESTYPMSNCEVLVVDGASTDSSCSIAANKLLKFPSARLLHNSKRIVPAGLNLAIKLAKGRYIIRMDAHCEYQRDYIETCLVELERTGAANVGGLLLTLPGKNTAVSRCIALVSQHPVGVGASAFRMGVGNRFVDTVPFGAFRKEVFDSVGLYREDLSRNQDFELNTRLRSAGYQIYLSSKLCTKYYNSKDLAHFLRQAIANGQGAARCWVANPKSFCFRHAAPLLFVLSWLIVLVLTLFWHNALVVILVYGVLYSFALICAGVQIAINGNWLNLIRAPVIIALYHVCYGVSTGIELFKLSLSRSVIC